MEQKIIASERLGERCTVVNHPSGLTMLLCPMEGFSAAYALFATKYGSINDAFSASREEPVEEVPAGIAHFLEHKMFEKEDGDAFALYAKTGASANAYTSFDRTAYLFSCTDRFEETLGILLDMVTKPYFTAQTVKKEQGIIGQEIRMYEDDPDWRVYFNLLGALYHNHPISVDIAGTVDSIAGIDDKLLYRCYHTFYNLRNMVLAIAGNFEVEEALRVADRILKPAPPIDIQVRKIEEPRKVKTRRIEQKLEVASPLFQVGYKGVAGEYRQNVLDQVKGEILLDIVAGEASPLYRELYDGGLINAVFNTEVMAGPDYLAYLFAGESKDPDRVFSRIMEEVEDLRRRGVTEEAFQRARRASYGRYVGLYGNVESVAGLLALAQFSGVGIYELPELISKLTSKDLTALLERDFNKEQSALSVIKA